MSQLRIAVVAPLYESVPPKLYGGTERVVHFLTEQLVANGHHVTLFASGDSNTSARLVAPTGRSLRLDASCQDQLAHHIVQLQMVQNEIDNFDIIHYHIDFLHDPLSSINQSNHVTTLHGNLNIPDLRNLYRMYDEIPVVSISLAQRRPLFWLNWAGNVYHGLPQDLFKPNFQPGKYLAFLGRISPEKRVDRAIEIALACNIPLRIAAKIDRNDQEYFDRKIRKMLDHPLIEFVGEINEHQKEEFLGNALALLFPIDWPEPFGLVMIESMACGTPVIAYPNGSVPEIIEHGKSGFIVSNIKEAIRAVQRLHVIDRRECRRAFEERFTASTMAHGYTQIYETLIASRRKEFALKMMPL